ncbi:MAG TPA: efflux RND transporter periplasmic adaptor subunit [Bryobacteraceae bacterium]|nr:efflux RND transporter periplasmic adaptor subunit [Bryobacteraceae bacterium]
MGRYRAAKQAAKPVPPPIVIGPEIIASGKIQARQVVLVPAPISGKVDMFHVEVGQEVYQGQLIAQIKSEELEGARESALASLEKAQARVNSLDAALIAARLEASRAQADAARARQEFERAEKLYQRQKMLLEQGATPKLTHDKALKELTAAQAELDNAGSVTRQADSRVESLQKELDNARKALDENNQDLEEAKAELSAGEVHSPVDGVVSERRGQPGDEVNPTMKDLFQIATDLSALEIVVEPQPAAMARIHAGQNALIQLPEMPTEAFPGTVDKVENGRVTVRFASPNPVVKPGLTASVKIKLT